MFFPHTLLYTSPGWGFLNCLTRLLSSVLIRFASFYSFVFLGKTLNNFVNRKATILMVLCPIWKLSTLLPPVLVCETRQVCEVQDKHCALLVTKILPHIKHTPTGVSRHKEFYHFLSRTLFRVINERRFAVEQKVLFSLIVVDWLCA